MDYSIRPETLTEGFTQTELGTMDDCARKWNLGYNNKLERKDFFDWNLWIGELWHTFQHSWRSTKGKINPKIVEEPVIPKNIARTSDFEQELDYWMNVMPTFQEEYIKFYAGEQKLDYLILEEELSAEFLGFKIRGKLDLVDAKKRFIRDFKTTSSAWFIAPDGWHFKLQFMVYCWLMSKNHPEFTKDVFEFQLCILQKPALKKTDKETWPQHIQRTKADIQKRPEFYFQRKPAIIEPKMIRHFEETVLTPKIMLIIGAQEQEKITGDQYILSNPNTNHCNAYNRKCQFWEICEKGWESGKHFFVERDKKHREL